MTTGRRYIPEVKLARDADDKPFEWAGADIGFRSKLGGKPNFVQSEEWPKCDCGEEMTFYGQLDSMSDQYAVADVGMIYVFLCFDCFETTSMVQSG